MFKKSLAAVALLGAFAGSAFAADVTLYGVVDEGFLYTHKDADKTDTDAVDKFELRNGIQAGSRWGLKGTEDLGNGLKVGFILESGFNADDGTQSVSGTMFNREASLNVMGPFGQLSLGKIGAITQGTSSWGKVGAVSAFGTSYGAANVGNATNVFAATVGVMDNTIAYQTPKFAGFTVYAQYSWVPPRLQPRTVPAGGQAIHKLKMNLQPIVTMPLVQPMRTARSISILPLTQSITHHILTRMSMRSPMWMTV